MTEPSYSWLYGASQPQECPKCGVPVQPGPDNAYEHRRYWCDDRAKSTAVQITPDMARFQASLLGIPE